MFAQLWHTQLRQIFKGKMIAAGGFEPDTAEAAVKEGVVDAVTFGRYFVSNPDLPQRIREGLPLSLLESTTRDVNRNARLRMVLTKVHASHFPARP